LSVSGASQFIDGATFFELIFECTLTIPIVLISALGLDMLDAQAECEAERLKLSKKMCFQFSKSRLLFPRFLTLSFLASCLVYTFIFFYVINISKARSVSKPVMPFGSFNA